MKLSHIARSSLIIAFFFGIDKVFGLVRQMLFSRLFNTNELDIFLSSNNIPDLLSALISGGALGIALIPVMSEQLSRQGRQAAWRLFSRILNLAFIVTAAISLLIILFAQPLVQHVTAPGFDAEKQAMTVNMMRLDLGAILIFSLSGLVMAGLQANQHFLFPAMAPVLYNTGQIIGALILAPTVGVRLGPVTLPAFGLGLYGLVWGVILGASMHLAIQVPGLLLHGFQWTSSLDLKDTAVRQVLRLMGPRLLTVLCLQIYFLARDNFASRLGVGSVAVLNYGWFIQQMPETLIGTAIAIALLPSLSEQVSQEREQEFRDTINRALRVMLALTLPAAALLAATIQPLAAIVFRFPDDVTTRLAWATRLYLLGLTGHTWLEVAVRSFYARQDALTPLKIAFLQICTYLALAFGLSRLMGVNGLALADSLTFTGQALLLLFLLRRRAPGILQVGGTLLRAVIGSLLGGAAAYLALVFLPLPRLPLSIAALLLGGVIILPFIWKEIKMLVRL